MDGSAAYVESTKVERWSEAKAPLPPSVEPKKQITNSGVCI